MAVLNAGIVGLGICLPERVVTNAEIIRQTAGNAAEIQSLSGIVERRIVAENQAASDLGLVAAKHALTQAGIGTTELDLIIVATVTGDMQFPSTACIIQDRLGARNVPAFDVAAACSGFLYGLTIGSQFISSGFYQTVLVIGIEVTSSVVDWTNHETNLLFGDGAGAAVLRPVAAGYGILAAKLGADGSGAKHLFVPAGGSRLPLTPELLAQKQHKAHMNGAEIFKFAIKMLPQVTEDVLAMANLQMKDVKLLIPHQANLRIVEAAARRMDLPMEAFMVNMDRYGNTSAASIPIALHEAWSTGRFGSGDVVVMSAVGGGLTWGSVVMRWL
jgi:3-oxoacyl-[acyl-carrier-protein] synthase III